MEFVLGVVMVLCGGEGLVSGGGVGGGVPLVEDAGDVVDVHGVEGAGGGQVAGAVADEEVGGAFREVPDVCFDAGAAPAEGFEEGDAAPVVIVGVAVNGLHVAG